MARYMEPTAEQVASWNEWVATRPKVIQELAERFGPWTMFRYLPTNHRCYVLGYSEHVNGDGTPAPPTMMIVISGRHNLIDFGRRVFGVKPEDLVECDLPYPGEPLGETLTQDEQFQMVNEVRKGNGLRPLTRQQFKKARSRNVPNCVFEEGEPNGH